MALSPAVVASYLVKSTHDRLLDLVAGVEEGTFLAASLTAPSIGFHVWHIARWADLYGRDSSVGAAILARLGHANRHPGMIEALVGVAGARGTATV